MIAGWWCFVGLKIYSINLLPIKIPKEMNDLKILSCKKIVGTFVNKTLDFWDSSLLDN